MRVEKRTSPMRLVVSDTHIRFTKFNVVNERIGGRYVEIENDSHLVAKLFDEDAQEFIKLMEQE